VICVLDLTTKTYTAFLTSVCAIVHDLKVVCNEKERWQTPKNCALLDGNRNRLNSKTTAKFKDKQTSIAMVQDLLRTFATFPTPFLSRYRLPLKAIKRSVAREKIFSITIYMIQTVSVRQG
jgi:hypothetical protein